MRDRIKRHNGIVISVVVSVEFVLAALYFKLTAIPLWLYVLLTILGILSPPGVARVVAAKRTRQAISRWRWRNALKEKIGEIGRGIDNGLTAWIRRWFHTYAEHPNTFFDWLLPGVNVNVACAEHKPHPVVPAYHHSSTFEMCQEHAGYFDHDGSKSKTACFFALNELPRKIEDRLGNKYSRFRDGIVSIECRTDGNRDRPRKASLFGWNVFGLLFRCGSVAQQNRRLAQTDRLFVRIGWVWFRPAALLPTVFYVRLRMDKRNAQRASANEYFFARFDHDYRCDREREYDVNEPVCALR